MSEPIDIPFIEVPDVVLFENVPDVPEAAPELAASLMEGRDEPLPPGQGEFAPYPASPRPLLTMRLSAHPVLPSYGRLDPHRWDRYYDSLRFATPAQRRIVLKRDDYTCRMCLRRFNDCRFLTVDHIVPHSHGGWTVLVNLQCACVDCNVSKGDRSSVDLRGSTSPLVARIHLSLEDFDLTPYTT